MDEIGAVDERRPRARRSRASGCWSGSVRTRASCSPRTSAPTATRSARWWGCRACSRALGKDSADVHRARGPAAALRVPLLRAGRPDLRASGGYRRSAPSCSWTAATSTATRRACCSDGRHLLNIDHHHDNTRFGTLDHVVPGASCTAEIVWDLMHGLGVRPTPAVARGAVCRADHRHGALHVREHRSARARDGRRADRRGRGRAGRVQAAVRGDAGGEARAARAGARPDAAL